MQHHKMTPAEAEAEIARVTKHLDESKTVVHDKLVVVEVQKDPQVEEALRKILGPPEVLVPLDLLVKMAREMAYRWGGRLVSFEKSEIGRRLIPLLPPDWDKNLVRLT